MTSVDAVRESLLATIDGFLQRPGMFVGTAGEAEVLYWQISQTMKTIEGHEPTGEQAELERYGELGMSGPFRALFGEAGDYRAEVVSVIAQLAAIRKFRTPTTVIAASTWDAWTSDLRARFEQQDARRSQVRERFGEPSFGVEAPAGELQAAVDAYMREDDATRWLFFDYRQKTAQRLYDGDGASTMAELEYDPWLRSVRHPADRWQDGVILTAYGKRQR